MAFGAAKMDDLKSGAELRGSHRQRDESSEAVNSVRPGAGKTPAEEGSV
jgi:hypothetical protein